MEVTTQQSRADLPQGVALKKQTSTQLSISVADKRKKWHKKSSTPEKAANEAALRKLCKEYKGVSLVKSSGKFQAFITLDKMRSMGSYHLAANAALAVDKASDHFKAPGQYRNRIFPTLKQYFDARDREIAERGLDWQVHEADDGVCSKFISKIGEDVKA
jgi:hypothetical protein